jgi:hypothetical protein
LGEQAEQSAQHIGFGVGTQLVFDTGIGTILPGIATVLGGRKRSGIRHGGSSGRFCLSFRLLLAKVLPGFLCLWVFNG